MERRDDRRIKTTIVGRLRLTEPTTDPLAWVGGVVVQMGSIDLAYLSGPDFEFNHVENARGADSSIKSSPTSK